MGLKWTDSEEALLEHLDGRYVGKKFISEYKRLAAIKKLPARSTFAITTKASSLGITLNGGVFDSFTPQSLAKNLCVSWHRVKGWILRKGLPVKKTGGRNLILMRDFIPWAKEKIEELAGIQRELVYWLIGENLPIPAVAKNERKSVVRLSDKTVFSSINAASKSCYLSRGAIRRALRFGTEAGGSKWEYVSQCN